MTGELTLPFAALDAASLPIAGGKAANLGEMTRAGLPVPPGFCVTTAAYERVAAKADMTPIFAALETTAPVDTAAQARERLLAAPIPPDVAEAVRAAYRALGDSPSVAVRSSATAEDLPNASFAGQQDTYLGIQGEDAVLDAVRRCWASLFTDRAVAYRASQGIDHRQVQLAVVVQRMVDSHVAGVLFTANPLTGRRHEAVIDASWGLGEAVVSGAVNPDHFVVDALTGRVRDRRLGDKRLAIRRAAHGTTHEALPDGSDTPCLTDAQLAELAALGRRVEAHYGAPQDLEFAFDAAGTLYLLQARPITTLYPLPAGARPDDPALRVYFSVNVAQGVLQPFTPMGIQAFRLVTAAVSGLTGHPVADSRAGIPSMAEAGDRLYVDVTGIVRDRLGRRLFLAILTQMEARSGVGIAHLLDTEPSLRPTDTPPWRTFLKVAHAFKNTGVPQRVLQALRDPEARRRKVPEARSAFTAIGRAPADASPSAHLDAFERLFRDGVPILVREVVPATASGLFTNVVLARLLDGIATSAELQIAKRALPHNPTTEMDLALWALAKAIADAPAAREALLESPLDALVAGFRAGTLPPPLGDGLTGFLATYGHRALPEIDMGIPRWNDDPGFIFGALKNLVRQADSPVSPDAQFKAAEAEALAMVKELGDRAAAKGHLRGKLTRFFLGRMRELMGLRESMKFNLVALLAEGRSRLAPVGEALAADGRIAAADDVYFLTVPELRRAIAGEDMRGLVGDRRATYRLETARRHVPRVLLSDGREPAADTAPDAEGALRGTGASPGVVTARARVVLDPVGAHLEPGEILVAPSTDPGWTPLFLTAGGLVMEMGGAMSHGAVVAREYGIPAVVGVPRATELIASGLDVTVDGTAGVVSPSTAE